MISSYLLFHSHFCSTISEIVSYVVDQLGVVSPTVTVQSEGTPIPSFNNQFCIVGGNNISLICNSTIEQGDDVKIEWLKEVD